VVRLLDNFRHAGPNGQHMCMVFEALGDNLLTLIKRFDYRGLPLSAVKELTLHMLVGLDFLHRQLSIIHTDLKPENVLLIRSLDGKKRELRQVKGGLAGSGSWGGQPTGPREGEGEGGGGCRES